MRAPKRCRTVRHDRFATCLLLKKSYATIAIFYDIRRITDNVRFAADIARGLPFVHFIGNNEYIAAMFRGSDSKKVLFVVTRYKGVSLLENRARSWPIQSVTSCGKRAQSCRYRRTQDF